MDIINLKRKISWADKQCRHQPVFCCGHQIEGMPAEAIGTVTYASQTLKPVLPPTQQKAGSFF